MISNTTRFGIVRYLNAMRKKKLIDVVEKKGVISVKSVDRKHKCAFDCDIIGVNPSTEEIFVPLTYALPSNLKEKSVTVIRFMPETRKISMGAPDRLAERIRN